MATLRLPFDIEEYDKLLVGDLQFNEFLENILKDRGIEEFDDGIYGEIIAILISYHDTEGGAPEIHDFDIVDSSFDFVTQKGKLELHYWVNFYYGCSDIDSETDDYENWFFKIDLIQQVLIVEVPEYNSLSPSEEL
jgi:hypothetical protein